MPACSSGLLLFPEFIAAFPVFISISSGSQRIAFKSKVIEIPVSFSIYKKVVLKWFYFPALGGHDESKLYSSAAAAAAAAAAVSSAVPEVASVLSPSQLVGYGRILRF